MTDSKGSVQFDAPKEGLYTYTIVEDGTVVLSENIALYEGVYAREDSID